VCSFDLPRGWGVDPLTGWGRRPHCWPKGRLQIKSNQIGNILVIYHYIVCCAIKCPKSSGGWLTARNDPLLFFWQIEHWTSGLANWRCQLWGTAARASPWELAELQQFGNFYLRVTPVGSDRLLVNATLFSVPATDSQSLYSDTTQLNSTQLSPINERSDPVDSVCRSWRHKQKHDWLGCTLFNWVSWVESSCVAIDTRL